VRRSFLSLVMLLACVGCGGGTQAGGEEDDATVDVAHVASPLFTPLYVAEAKGYFEAEGVKVKLNPVGSGQDAVPLASSGQIDVIVAGFSAGFFSALDSGLDLRVVGSMSVGDGNSEDPPSALEVASKLVDGGDVRTPADLKGRRIAVAGGPGGSGAYLLDLVLREAGISVKDVTLTNITNADMPAALSSGSVDAVMTSAPFTEAIEKAGTGKALAVPPAGSSSTGVIYSEKFAKTEQAQAFFNALARAAKELQGDARNAPENIDPVAKVMKVESSVIMNLPRFTWRPDLAPLPDQLEAMQRTWLDAKQLTYGDPIPTSEFTDTKFSENAKKASN